MPTKTPDLKLSPKTKIELFRQTIADQFLKEIAGYTELAYGRTTEEGKKNVISRMLSWAKAAISTAVGATVGGLTGSVAPPVSPVAAWLATNGTQKALDTLIPGASGDVYRLAEAYNYAQFESGGLLGVSKAYAKIASTLFAHAISILNKRSIWLLATVLAQRSAWHIFRLNRPVNLVEAVRGLRMGLSGLEYAVYTEPKGKTAGDLQKGKTAMYLQSAKLTNLSKGYGSNWLENEKNERIFSVEELANQSIEYSIDPKNGKAIFYKRANNPHAFRNYQINSIVPKLDPSLHYEGAKFKQVTASAELQAHTKTLAIPHTLSGSDMCAFLTGKELKLETFIREKYHYPPKAPIVTIYDNFYSKSHNNYSRKDLSGAIISRYSLKRGGSFENSTLVGTFLINCSLPGISFEGTNAGNATFDGSDLSDTRWSGSKTKLPGASYRGCQLAGAAFTDAQYAAFADFSGAQGLDALKIEPTEFKELDETVQKLLGQSRDTIRTTSEALQSIQELRRQISMFEKNTDAKLLALSEDLRQQIYKALNDRLKKVLLKYDMRFSLLEQRVSRSDIGQIFQLFYDNYGKFSSFYTKEMYPIAMIFAISCLNHLNMLTQLVFNRCYPEVAAQKTESTDLEGADAEVSENDTPEQTDDLEGKDHEGADHEGPVAGGKMLTLVLPSQNTHPFRYELEDVPEDLEGKHFNIAAHQADIHERLGRSAYFSEDYPTAVINFEVVTKLLLSAGHDPQTERLRELRMLWGNSLFNLRDYNGALKQYQLVVGEETAEDTNVSVTTTKVLYNLGGIYRSLAAYPPEKRESEEKICTQSQEFLESAAAYYKRVISIANDPATATFVEDFLLNFAYEHLAEMLRRLLDYKRSSRADGKAGYTEEELQELREIQGYVLSGIAIRPSIEAYYSSTQYTEAAVLEWRMARYQKSAQGDDSALRVFFETAIRKDPKNVKANVLYCEYLCSKGDLRIALESLNKALSIKVDDCLLVVNCFIKLQMYDPESDIFDSLLHALRTLTSERMQLRNQIEERKFYNKYKSYERLEAVEFAMCKAYAMIGKPCNGLLGELMKGSPQHAYMMGRIAEQYQFKSSSWDAQVSRFDPDQFTTHAQRNSDVVDAVLSRLQSQLPEGLPGRRTAFTVWKAYLDNPVEQPTEPSDAASPP